MSEEIEWGYVLECRLIRSVVRKEGRKWRLNVRLGVFFVVVSVRKGEKQTHRTR